MNNQKLEWHTEQRKISNLSPFKHNPRILSDSQIAQLKKSIEKFNFVEIPVIDIDGKIIAGHQRIMVMQLLGRGDEIIDVRVPNRILTEKEFKEYNLRSNKNTGDWDFDILKNEFDLEMLQDVGFEDFSFFETENNNVVEDSILETTNEPIAKSGDLWQLGKHKILCGDCTTISAIDALFAGEKCGQVLADPPYGVNYAAKNIFLNNLDDGNRIQTEIQNDNIENYRQFFSDFLSIIPTADYNTFYVFMSGLQLHNLRLAFEDCNLVCSDYLVWCKNNHAIGHKDYNCKHEFCVYGWRGKHKFYGDFSTTILEFDRQQINDLHPTMKPIKLLAKLITDGSKLGEVVYDAFLGSGSTLIACEQTGRVCYGMEIVPMYIDVTIARWEKFTGNKATLIKNIPAKNEV